MENLTPFEKLLIGIIFDIKVNVVCGTDNRLILLNVIEAKEIEEKYKKIFLSIALNMEIYDSLEEITKEFCRLKELSDSWDIEEQLHWRE